MLPAVDVAELTGEKAIRKSSLRLALDCWATSAEPSVPSKDVRLPSLLLTICEVYEIEPLVGP